MAGSAHLNLLLQSHSVLLGSGRHGRHGSDAPILSEFARGQACFELDKITHTSVFLLEGDLGSLSKRFFRVRNFFNTYHLVNLLEGAVLHLGKVEERPDGADQARGKPDVAVFWPPVERVGIDEVRGGESRQPGAEEANRRGQAEGVASESLGWELGTAQPGVGCNHAVVADDVDHRDPDNDLQGRVWMLVPRAMNILEVSG